MNEMSAAGSGGNLGDSYDDGYPEHQGHQDVVLPHSLEAEQAVIGGLMLAGDKIFDQVSTLVREGDFYRPEHRLIFSALGRLAEDREPFDPITICDDLGGRKELDKAGGSTYIADLAATTPSAANIEAYAHRARASDAATIDRSGRCSQR